MKKTLAGLFIAFIVIAALLAVIDLEPYLATKEDLPTKKNARIVAGKSKEIINRIKPETVLVPTGIAEPSADESKSSNKALEPPPSMKIDSDLAPIGKIPPQPTAIVNIKETDSQPPTLITNQKSSDRPELLNDTNEKAERQVVNQHPTQVAETSPNPIEKPAAVSDESARSAKKESINLEIAVTPENNYPFSILLETFDELTTAQQAVALYRKQGIASFWVKVKLGNSGVKYRLFTGMFHTEAEGQTFVRQNHLTGKFVKNAAYAARIGVFRDKKELALAFVKTSEAGTSPYIIGKESGPFFLYVGAFYTADGAETQCRELAEKGLPCQALLRATLQPKK